MVISPDDAFKYTSFYREFLNVEPEAHPLKSVDLCGFVCPAPKVKAVQVIEAMDDGETVELILGDKDSLKSIIGELKIRGIKAAFKQTDDGKFFLTFTK